MADQDNSGELLVVTVNPEPSAPAAGIPYQASSLPLGLALRRALSTAAHRPAAVVIDLAGARTHDGGAGLLAGLGADADGPLDAGVAGLGSVTTLDLTPARELLAGVELLGVCPPADVQQPLLGLRGITSLRGRAVGEDAERLLATDATLERFAGLCSMSGSPTSELGTGGLVTGAPETAVTGPGLGTAPGAGACGGTGLGILALGGRVLTGAAYAAERGGLADTARQADLVVTGCNSLDFASRGGGVLAEVAALAEQAIRPCIVIAGEVLVGSRELRAMGIESAYPVREPVLPSATGLLADGEEISAAELGATAARIARSWSW